MKISVSKALWVCIDKTDHRLPLSSLSIDIEEDYKRLQNLTMEEYNNYFDNVEDHPKFAKVDLNTKLFYKLMLKRVKLHLSGEGNKGTEP